MGHAFFSCKEVFDEPSDQMKQTMYICHVDALLLERHALGTICLDVVSTCQRRILSY